jgi:hypothetical protein
MKTFGEFIFEAKTIRSKEDAEKLRQQKDNPDDYRVRNKGGGHHHPIHKDRLAKQQQRRSENLKAISKKELEDHAKRNLHPSPSSAANKALKIERERKKKQREEAQNKSRETGRQHDVDHIQAQANRKGNSDRWHKIHPGDASDNRRVIPQSDNLTKNSKDTGAKKTTRASVIRRALQRAREN